MHIRKTPVVTEYAKNGYVFVDHDAPKWQYAVHYKGFVASGPDLGACIAACHTASRRECSWVEPLGATR